MKFSNKLLNTVLLTAGTCLTGSLAAKPATALEHTYIVQADSATHAAHAVLETGGDVKRKLSIIDAVAAELTETEADKLRIAGLRVTLDAGVQVNRTKKVRKQDTTTLEASTLTQDAATETAEWAPTPAFPRLVDADDAHAKGITGRNVTVAVLDTGFASIDGLEYTQDWQWRLRTRHCIPEQARSKSDDSGENHAQNRSIHGANTTHRKSGPRAQGP